MEDIVDERYEWTMFGEEELFGARPLRCAAGEVDWLFISHSFSIGRDEERGRFAVLRGRWTGR